jgi:hypothetical protein
MNNDLYREYVPKAKTGLKKNSPVKSRCSPQGAPPQKVDIIPETAKTFREKHTKALFEIFFLPQNDFFFANYLALSK